jgi:hypothetical protein
MTKIKHHGLVVERLDDDILLLTQRASPMGPVDIRIGAGQLRDICEQLGIVRDPQSIRTIARLQRRMLVLYERIEALADWMARHSDHKHADLTYETTKLNALLDLAAEWCEDFAETETNTAPASAPAPVPAPAPAPPPGNNLPKAAAVAAAVADGIDLFTSTS